MKISGYTVRLRHKPARVICDVLSLGVVIFTFMSTHIMIERYPELQNPAFRAAFIKLWAFPMIALIPLALYLFMIFSNHRMKRYKITEDNAQDVYDWFAFVCSLSKLPVLVAVADAMITYQSRLIGQETPLFSIGYIFYALILAIIIRFSMHRIRKITEPPKSAEASSGIKVTAKIADNNDKTKNDQ